MKSKIIPFVFSFCLVAVFSVNFPYWDDWDSYLGFLQKIQLSGWSWSELWVPHNEHRIVLAKLVFYFLSLFGLGPKAVMIASQGLYLANFFLLEKLFSKTTPVRQFFISALFFSLVQREVMFCSFNIQWAWMVTGILLCILGLKDRSDFKLFSGLSISFLSMSSWVILLVPVGYRVWKYPKAIRFLASMALAFCLAAYLYGLKPSGVFEAIYPKNWLAVIGFYLRTLGSPFVMTGKHQHWILHGLAILLGATYLVWAAILGLQRKLPMLSIVVGFMILLITLGRFHDGLDGAGIASRYTAITLLGWIALIWSPFKIKNGWVYGLCCLGIASSLINGAAEVIVRRPKLLQAQKIVWKIYQGEELHPGEVEALSPVYPRPLDLVEKVRDLKKVPAWDPTFMFR